MENEKQRLESSRFFSNSSYAKQKEITERQVKSDAMFREATKMAYKTMYGEALEGTDEEIADKGLQLVSDALVPIATFSGAGMSGTYLKFNSASKEEKQALWYMIDSVDRKNITYDGFVRGVESIGKDPTTYTGIGAGWAFFGKQATKNVAKKRLKEMLLASGVGGAYTGSEEYVRQEVQDISKNWGDIGTMTTIGAVATPLVGAIGTKAGKVALEAMQDLPEKTAKVVKDYTGVELQSSIESVNDYRARLAPHNRKVENVAKKNNINDQNNQFKNEDQKQISTEKFDKLLETVTDEDRKKVEDKVSK